MSPANSDEQLRLNLVLENRLGELLSSLHVSLCKLAGAVAPDDEDDTGQRALDGKRLDVGGERGEDFGQHGGDGVVGCC